MTNVAEILRQQLKAAPGKTALVLQYAGQPDLVLSRSAFLSRARDYASTYQQRRIEPGEVVVLILPHGLELVCAFFGAILGGQIPAIMPFLTEKLNPERYKSELANLVTVSKPAAIVTNQDFEPEIRLALGEESTVRALLLCNEVEQQQRQDVDDLPGLNSPPESIVVLQHSSGTTGLQKGVALSHQALLNQISAYSAAIQLVEQDVVVSWLPLYHDMGLISSFLMPILSGIPLVLMSPFDWVRAPQRLFQAISQYHGTLTWLPNFAYNFCAQKIRDRHMEGVDLTGLRAFINCSEPVRKSSHDLFYEKFQAYGLKNSTLQTCYAMAENVFGVTQSPLGKNPLTILVDQDDFQHEHKINPAQPGKPALEMMSSGQPISNTQIHIVDGKGHELTEGQMGEIILKSNSMLNGYYQRPDLTTRAIHSGWYHTGDLGFMSDGELFVTGRRKDLIIVGGKNIYPEDIEALVNTVPGVHLGRAVAFGLFDESQGTEEVVVVAEVEPTTSEERQVIADKIRQVVTRNSAVALRLVYTVGPKWLLKTSSGKIARSANRDKYLAETH
jgi:acyl-CoA synthetase (AMP-forming)/AMP-acid ligase II